MLAAQQPALEQNNDGEIDLQNMEKYYGFRVGIDGELDPIRVEALKEVAAKIISAYDFNEEEYFVYFHQLSIEPKEEHFGLDGGLSKRLKRADLSFSVNLKQRRMRRIKLFNFLLDKAPEDPVKWTGGADEVKYFLDGQYLEDNLGFRNELVTFISKKVRSDHRKIKVSLVAYPTDKYIKVLKNQPDSHLTQLDFKFQKAISLRVPKNISNKNKDQNPNPKIKEHESGVTIMGDNYNIYGQAASVGKKSKSDNTTNQQIVLSKENSGELKNELELLRAAMRESAQSTDDDLAVVEIGKAIEASSEANNNNVLTHLKSAGKKALDVSEKIGVSLVTALLKQELGL